MRIYTALNSYDRAKRVSDMLANRTVPIVNPSHGQRAKEIQISHSEAGRPLMTADEILTMPRNEALVFVRGLRPMLLQMAHYGEIDPWCDMVGDNPLEGRQLRGEPKFRIAYPENGDPDGLRIAGVAYWRCSSPQT